MWAASIAACSTSTGWHARRAPRKASILRRRSADLHRLAGWNAGGIVALDHPVGILPPVGADLVQLANLVRGKSQSRRFQIVVELLQRLGANDGGGDERLLPHPGQRDARHRHAM